jgi:Phage integrase family
MQKVLKRLKARAGITGRCSPPSLRHTFARRYLVNGGEAFSLQRILGHTTLDMVKRWVSLAAFEIVRRLHVMASPAVRLVIGPMVSIFLPRERRPRRRSLASHPLQLRAEVVTVRVRGEGRVQDQQWAQNQVDARPEPIGDRQIKAG